MSPLCIGSQSGVDTQLDTHTEVLQILLHSYSTPLALLTTHTDRKHIGIKTEHPSLHITDLQFGVPCQEGCDTVVTFGAVAGFSVHYPVHYPAGVKHVHHKHPHDQGGERCFQEHDASVVLLRCLP